MKKLLFLGSAISSLLIPDRAFAQININRPEVGFTDLGDFIGKIITLAFAIGVLIVLIMLIWGAFEWIASGGDKEAVGKARNRIINALIGLAVLAIAFALVRLGAQFIGLGPNFPGTLSIPSPNRTL